MKKTLITLFFVVALMGTAFAEDVTVEWTAVHEDGNTGGPATGYVLCYGPDSTAIINSSVVDGFAVADSLTTIVEQDNVPGNVGDTLQYTVSGLVSGIKYYFTMKAFDDVDNYSDLGNIVSHVVVDVIKPGVVDIIKLY